MSAWCVVVAAGRGERAELGRNKVFYRHHGRSILSRCLDNLAGMELFDGIVLVLSRADEEEYADLCAREGACPLVRAVAWGGKSRRESVLNGLHALPGDVGIVAVHDAARPFVSREAVLETLRSAERWGSGVISTPVVDTIKLIDDEDRVHTPERSSLRAVQTPQSFEYHRLLDAHERAQRENLSVTDDAMLFEHYYGGVRLVTCPSAADNPKLTTKADFDMLNRSIVPDLRVGHGYDAHRLAAGRKLILCGVEVPHDRGLDGHSDADVAVHALMDALLGALGMGDIGRLFPDSDPAYEGISSMRLLEEVMRRVRAEGFFVMNADVTIVAQRPKLLPWMDRMRDNLASALGVEPSRVNVKATTTERMGFEGEELGISAQAVALLAREVER